MKFVLASGNKKKIEEVRRILCEISPESELLSLSDIGFCGDIVEDGDTFEANALIKASVPASMGYIGIADDSGICVDALGGAPGVYSARYSGEGHTDEKNNAKLISELRNVPYDERTAHYVCAVACVFPEEYGIEPIVSYGSCGGKIVFEPKGNGGFGYDPYFFREEEGRTMAELTAEEKDSISHRGEALRGFAETIRPILKELEK